MADFTTPAFSNIDGGCSFYHKVQAEHPKPREEPAEASHATEGRQKGAAGRKGLISSGFYRLNGIG
jgi:hypothetical protein